MSTNEYAQRLVSRTAEGIEDFWRVRDLLLETFPITPPDFNWDIRRWDGSFFHHEEPGWHPGWNRQVRLWETEDGRLVGAAHPDGGGDAVLQLHPDYGHIAEEMMSWAEDHLGAPTEDGKQRQLHVFAYEYDSACRRLLEERGYEKTTWGGVMRRLRLGSKPLPQVVMAEGYGLRTTRAGDERECERVASLFNAAFNRDCHTAGEICGFWATSPSYRRDLELVAEAPDGSLAALIGMIYEEANQFGLFEPVCTHPDHIRKGLASALMFEGMHRVKALGAVEVYVATGDMVPANRLYESVGFTEVYQGYIWRKLLPAETR